MKRFFIAAAKTFVIVIGVGFCSVVLLALKAKKLADDVWKQLGLTQGETNWNINYSFNYGAFYYQGAKNARNIAAGDRVAVIRDLAAYAKKYAASDEFKKSYAAYRLRKKPQDPFNQRINVDSIKAAEKERIEKAIKDTEGHVNHPNPKVRNAVPSRLEALRRDLATIDDPNNRNVKARVDQMQRMNDASAKQYADQMKKYDAQYPEDPRAMIKARLQQMLDITADVDYNAETHQDGRLKRFTNPAYEKKPNEWKLAYRAGKAATDELRAIAQKWLQELN
jgi:hypothetical protein